MKIYKNYNIGMVLGKTESGDCTPVMQYLRGEIESYRRDREEEIREAMLCIGKEFPESEGAISEDDTREMMRWITDHVKADIAFYVRREIKGEPYDVLRKAGGRWKTIADIGIRVEESEKSGNKPEGPADWMEVWRQQAEVMKQIGLPVFETHAHYDLDVYEDCREELISLIHDSGIDRLIIPAIGYESNERMQAVFGGPEYEWIHFAFGIHPKYVWKDPVFGKERDIFWSPKSEVRWENLKRMAEDRRCIAIGETGLDYSYAELDERHRELQKAAFIRQLEIANGCDLPVILHIRSSDKAGGDADQDALAILSGRLRRGEGIKRGGVVHCFGGSFADVQAYQQAGIGYFGIGGRICCGEPELEDAVRRMPEEGILLETDSPYIRIDGGRRPNTSLILARVASKIAELRGTTPEHIAEVTHRNAERLFG